MKKQSVKKNYIYNLCYQILIILLPLVTTPYLSRVLGANGIGIYSYTVSITTYFILLGSLGLNLYGQREIAYVQADKEERDKVFSEIFWLKLIFMLLALFIFYITLCIHNQYSLYYKILVLEILANIIDISWLYQGLEEFKKIVIRNSFVKIISLCLVFILIKNQNDLWLYLLIYALSIFLGNGLLWLNGKKYFTLKSKHLNIKKHIKPSLILFIPQIAIQIYVVLDKTMLGVILHDMSEVGYYEQAQKIVKVLLTIVSSISIVMMPRIACCHANKDKSSISNYMLKTFQFIFMFSIPLMLGIILIADKFVPIFFGNGYNKVINVMQIMSPIVLFIGLSSTIGNGYLLSIKKQKEYTISVVIGAVVNFLLNILLISKYKSIGACIATVIAEFSVTAVQLFYIQDQFKIKYILKEAKNYFFSGICMFLLCIWMRRLPIAPIHILYLQIGTGILVYFVILILLRDKMLISLFQNIFVMYKKIKGGFLYDKTGKRKKEKNL